MTGALSFNLRGVGLLGPGFRDWSSSKTLLADPSRWVMTPAVLPAPARLPAAERRRAGAIVKVCLAVADEACDMAGVDTRSVPTVFAASTGDAANCHAMCEVLATEERQVSPTRFTNSVHNAPAGYWHIATSSRAPSTSLSAHDGSFAAGLLEAAAECVAWRRAVLLVAADVPYPEPLHGARPLPDAMSVAMLIGPDDDERSLARLTVQPCDPGSDACSHPGLESLRRSIPCAAALPLLQRLARREAGDCVIAFHESLALRVTLEPGVAE